MIKRAELSRREKRIVNKIVDIQLDSLRDILNRDVKRDLTMYCIECGVQESQLQEFFLEMVTKFERLRMYPEEIFNLDADNLETARTILVHIDSPKHAEGKRLLFGKFNVIDKLNEYHTLN